MDDTEQLMCLGRASHVPFCSQRHCSGTSTPQSLLSSGLQAVWPMGGTGARLKDERRAEAELLHSASW